MVQEVMPSSFFLVLGSFTTEEDEALCLGVMRQTKTAEFHELTPKSVDWAKVCVALGRSAEATEQRFSTYVWPIVAKFLAGMLKSSGTTIASK